MKKAQNGTLQKKKKNSSSRESTKIISRPGSTNNPRNVKSVSVVKREGIIKPKLGTEKVNTTKKNNKTEKQIILDALKKAPFGSNKRRTIYNRLGWKQDDTTTGYKKAKVTVEKSGLITPTSSKTMNGKVSTAKKASVSKPASKMAEKVSATRAKGKDALASGNKAKALRMKKREVRQTKRAIRKSNG